jgi:hypothetical protein
MKTIQTARLLKLALIVDAGASLGLAVLQLFMPSLLADYLSLPRLLVTGTGAFLVGYALMLVLVARTGRVWQFLVQFIIIGNVGWALGCLALAATSVVTPSGLGMAFLSLQAMAVLLFAWLEYAGLQASKAGVAGGALQYP